MSDTAVAARLAKEAAALLEQGSVEQAAWRLLDAAGLAYEACPPGSVVAVTGRGFGLVSHNPKKEA